MMMMMMDTRLEIASRVLAGMMTYDAEKATAKPAEEADPVAVKASPRNNGAGFAMLNEDGAIGIDRDGNKLLFHVWRPTRDAYQPETWDVKLDLDLFLRYLGLVEATAPKAEALPEDAPVMEWEVRVVGSGGGYVARARPTESNETMKAWHLMHDAADADLPAVRAAAVAYSAAKGCRAVFVEEGCKDA